MDSVEKLCKDFWDWRMSAFPEFATFCGFHEYDDRLNDHSVAAFQEKQGDAERFLKRCLALEAGNISLSEGDALNVTLLRSDLETFFDGMKHEGYVFPVSYMEGMHLDFEQLTSWMVFKTVTDFQRYVARLKALPLRVERDVELLRHGIAIQKTHSTYSLVYMKACRPYAGVSSMSDGQAFYISCLQYHTSLTLSPQQVHDIGLEEVKRIRDEMLEGALLEGFRHICYKQIHPVLSRIFHKIPKAELLIEGLPASRAQGPAAFYLNGTLDGSRDSKFFVNVHRLDNMATYDMMTLSLHEGEPGHHFQGMYAMEMKGMPEFRRYAEDMNYWQVPSRLPMHTAYVEGWGLYCEYLGKELGLYKDPYSLFGHLSAEMFRACRLVADTGLHALGWTYEQAVALFLENTAVCDAEVKDEVTRYITWPGQACAYKMGVMEIQRLRKKAAQQLGDQFDVRDFHAEVLQCGAVPLEVLGSIIDKYISRLQSCGC